MSIFAGLLAALPKLLSVVLSVMNIITAEKQKQAGINEQVLEQMRRQQEMQKAADDARKNPPPGNILDHF